MSVPRGVWVGQVALLWTRLASVSEVTRSDTRAIAFVVAGLAMWAASVWLARRTGQMVWLVPGVLLPLGALSITGGVGLAFVSAAAHAGLAWVTGSLMLRTFRMGGSLTYLERCLVAVGLGYGGLSFLSFGLGLAYTLTPAAIVIAACVLVGTIWALEQRSPTQPAAHAPTNRGALAPLAATSLIVLATAPFVVAPEVTYDATYYHLTIVRAFVEQHAVVQLPNLFASTFPLIPHLDYTLAAMFSSLDAAKFVHFGVGAWTILAIYALGLRTTGDARAAGLGAFAWGSAPLVLWEMSTAYVDLFSALFTVLALMAALMWLESRRPGAAVLVGVFAGFGLGIKPNMALVSGPLFATMFALHVRTRSSFVTWFGSGCVAVAIGMPWYLRAYLLTGNPVFPFLNGVFRSTQWAPTNENFNLDLFGMGRSLTDYVLLPWRLTMLSSRFAEIPDGALSLLPLLIPVGVLVAVLARSPQLRTVALFLVLSFGAWAIYAQYARYLLAALPTAAVLLGSGVRLPWLRSARVPSLPGWLALLIAVPLVSYPIYLSSFWMIPRGVPWLVAVGHEARDTYLASAFRQFDAYQWMRDNLSDVAHSNVLGLGLADWPIAYSPAPVYIAHMTKIGTDTVLARSPEATRADLQQGQFKYVLYDYFPRPPRWVGSWGSLVSAEFMASDLHLIYANNYVYLYAAGPSTTNGRATPVLQDPDLTRIRNGTPGPWQPIGTSDRLSSSDCPDVLVGPNSGFIQTFVARPNVLYTFVIRMKGATSTSAVYGKIQVNWQRSDGSGSASIEVDPITESTQSYEMSTTSPPNATHGIFYLTGFSTDEVCVTSASGTVAD